MISASLLAKYLIYVLKQQASETNIEEFDVTPLKLQKLLYYCQGYSLALTGKPMFSEAIEAWNYGPVVDSVYQEYKKYKGGIISLDSFGDFNEIDDTLRAIVQLVIREKGKLSAVALSNATHNETPWRQTHNHENRYSRELISQTVIKDYFTGKFLQREESEDEEDVFWKTQGDVVSKAQLEVAIEEI